jgi:hypothetical protein
MNIKNLFIPKEKAQKVSELESWTIWWEVKTGWSNATERYYKSFIIESEADEFKNQLRESAKFINAYICVGKNKN